MRPSHLSGFVFDLVNRAMFGIMRFHAKAALGGSGKVNLDWKTEGGIDIVEAAVRATRGGRSFCLYYKDLLFPPLFYFVCSSQFLRVSTRSSTCLPSYLSR